MAKIMTAKELADYLQMNTITIYKLANTARIPGVKIANQWRFPKNIIDEWLVTQSTENFKEFSKATVLR